MKGHLGDYIAWHDHDRRVRTSNPDLWRHHPTQLVRRDLTDIFRFDANGRLAEEWVQFDTASYLRQPRERPDAPTAP